MMIQELVLARFRESVTGKKSFTQTLADTLSINYDAAYRRQTLNTKLSVDEAMLLAKEGQFSLDGLFEKYDSHMALGVATPAITDLKSLEIYLIQTLETLKSIGKTDVTLLYSAKDIPVYHHFFDTHLSKFKVYVWMHILNPNENPVKLANYSLPPSIIEKMKAIASHMQSIQIHEIWNTTTISSSINQILYCHETEFINTEEAMQLFEELRQILLNIQERIKTEQLDLYVNELLIMTNSSLFYKNQEPIASLVPITMLGYVRFTASNMLHKLDAFFSLQKKQSISLRDTGVKQRLVFFKNLEKQIDNAVKNM